MGRKSASGSGNRDEQPGSYFLELRNHFFVFLGLKYLNSLMRIRDPGWRQVGSGMEKSRIRGKHPRICNTNIFTFLLQTQVRYGSCFHRVARGDPNVDFG
jgi:hypothetical protein